MEQVMVISRHADIAKACQNQGIKLTDVFAQVKEANAVVHTYDVNYPLVVLDANGNIPMDHGHVVFNSVKVATAEQYALKKGDTHANELVLKAKHALGVEDIHVEDGHSVPQETGNYYLVHF